MLSSHMFGVFVILTCVSPNFNAICFFSKNDSNATPLLIVCGHMNPLCYSVYHICMIKHVFEPQSVKTSLNDEVLKFYFYLSISEYCHTPSRTFQAG